MPKVIKEMTVLQLKQLPEGTYSVGGVPGLRVRIHKDNCPYFFLRYTSPQGKRRDLTLGQFPLVSLAEARDKAREAVKLLHQNIDPIEVRQSQRKGSQEEIDKPYLFQEIATMWHKERLYAGYYSRDARSAKTTENILNKHVFPILGLVPIEEITPKRVMECLAPIWTKTNPTAKKARSYISGILNYAIANEYRKNQYNPAMLQGPLGVLLQPMKNSIKQPVNLAACAVDEIPQLFREMRQYTSMSARACEFAVLTAARSKAVRLATWDEFDLEKGVWEIPVEHDKTKAPNRNRTIFLSPQAIALLKSLPRNPKETNLVFMSSQQRPMSDTTLLMFLRGLHEKRWGKDHIGWIDPDKSKSEGHPCVITIHGTARATFRTWAKDDKKGNNRRFDQEAVELCLLHGKNNRTTDMPGSGLGTAYDRAFLAQARQLIMKEWGDFCCSQLKK